MNTQYNTSAMIGIMVGFSTMSSAAAEAPELSPTLERVLNSVRTLEGTPVVDVNNPSNNPENVQRVMSLVGEEDFDFFFPQAAAVYDYESFLMAVAKFPAFCNEAADMSDIDQVCAKELAAVFAHFTQETGGHNVHDVIPEWRQGLYHVREMGCHDDGAGCEYRGGTCEEGTWQAEAWPCADGQKYYGRGAKQLSYNYNYGLFSDVIFGDVHVLLENPDRVAEEGWLALSSAIWFSMTPQAPKPSMHEMITGFWQPNATDKAAGIQPGFGATTLIINGGIECGGSVEHAASANRIKYYKAFTDALNVDHGDNLGCAGYNSFPAGGSGAVLTYWEKDWGKAGACKLVGYQTAYSVYKESDYASCVEDMWGDEPQESDNTAESSPENNHQNTQHDSNQTSPDAANGNTAECIVVTSWWPGECGVVNSTQTCERGWGTFETINDCCDAHFPDSETCGAGSTTKPQDGEEVIVEEKPASQPDTTTDDNAKGCRSAVSHISDAWCQAVECDDVYVDAGFCSID